MRRFVVALAVTLAAYGAHAQYSDEGAIADRLDRMERDLQTLQRQFYRGTVDGVPAATPGDLQMQGDAEGQLRAMTGRIEHLEHAIQVEQQQNQKAREDLEYRLQALEQRLNSESPAAKPQPEPAAAPQEEAQPAPKPGEKTQYAGSGVLGQDTVPPPPAAPAGDTPKELYNHAYQLMTQSKYDEAQQQFQHFLEMYPDDALAGNVFYWVGETYYVRRDYVKAADHFRQGFEKRPAGPKAPDNLLKLAMSLNALSRNKEACVILDQLQAKFGSKSGIKQKAESEQARIGCH